MCSSARWPSGWTRRWAGSGGRVHRAQRAQYQIPHAISCRALSVSPAWFYTWHHGDPSVRHARRKQLKIAVGRVFAAHRGTYGSPRITADLRDQGWRVSVNTVAAIMRELGPARTAATAAPRHDPAGPGTVAGTGPDRPPVRR
jgi:hypothetical protein